MRLVKVSNDISKYNNYLIEIGFGFNTQQISTDYRNLSATLEGEVEIFTDAEEYEKFIKRFINSKNTFIYEV